MSGLLLGMVWSVCTCWFHNMVTLPLWPVCTDCGACWYQCSLSNFTPIFSRRLMSRSAHCSMSLNTPFFCQYWARMWPVVLSHCWPSLHLLTVAVGNILLARYFVCNARSCTAIASLPVSPFRSPLDSQQERVFFTNKLSVHISNMLAMHYFAFSFAKGPPTLLSWVVGLLFSVSLFEFYCCFNCWIHILFTAFITFYSIDKLMLLTLCVQIYFAISIFSAVCHFNLQQASTPSFLYTYSLSTSAFVWWILYTVSLLLDFVFTFVF